MTSKNQFWIGICPGDQHAQREDALGGNDDARAKIKSARGGSEQRFLGLLIRKWRWGISGRGWLVILLSIFLLGGLVFPNLYSFLALTDPVQSKILVVEGWIHPYAARAAANEFRSGAYERIFSTGGPVVGKGGYVNDFQTAASVGADLLKKEGVPGDVVQMVPSHVLGRDRTYSSAVALKEWFREHHLQVQSVNVMTEGAHARRSRLLFQEALGNRVKVGIISVASPDFDEKHWWRYSEGVEDLIGEGIGYLYAKFLFYPSPSESGAK
jgi:uncharacterized SAM-binding protein YcdF (DUF218 family)